jgi:hypothetical protein
MLPESAWQKNFLTAAALEGFESWSKSGTGLMDKERGRRNLLSSQPLAFNLFGPFLEAPGALLAWVRTVDTDATAVINVRLEWAPASHETFGGGSAFDVFVGYEAQAESRFLGIECKYAEDLSKSSIKSIRNFTYPDGPKAGERRPSYVKYEHHTKHSGSWKAGATDRLDVPQLRQFWLNTMLAQKVVDVGLCDSGTSVVLACQADEAAWAATAAVRAELADRAQLKWASYEALIGTLHQLDWAQGFVRRYLDFAPVRHLLTPNDPRRNGRLAE